MRTLENFEPIRLELERLRLAILLIGVLLGEMGSDYIAAPVTYPFALRHTTVFHLSNGNNWLYLSIAFSKPSTSFAFAG